MPFVSIVCGGLLIGIGIWGYLASDLEGALKYTALIPAAVGALLAMCGLIALKESLLKHAMHAAAAVGLIGFLLAAGRFIPKAIREGVDFKDVGTVATGKMAFVCLVFVALCVNSFIQARKRRAAREGQGQGWCVRSGRELFGGNTASGFASSRQKMGNRERERKRQSA